MRLFCAVELPADVRARAAAHAARLRESLTTARQVSWEREEKLHLTIKFFGDVAPARCDQLVGAVGRAAARVAPFEARLAGAGVFPSHSRPSVLWLGVVGADDSLAALHAAVEEECARESFPHDTRRFHPHVTLARVRAASAGTRDLARLHEELGFEPVSFNVGELVLLRSELGARGSTYTAVSRHALGG
ncbi:MAG: RNA 2',3'-cyclic phosphodiesterase [Pyrinomonadaceae bacterium]